VRLRWRDTTRDVPGKREAISSLRASSNISTVPPRLSRARFTLTCRGAREEQGARPRVVSSYDETSIPFSSLSLYEHHEEEQRQSARDVVRTRWVNTRVKEKRFGRSGRAVHKLLPPCHVSRWVRFRSPSCCFACKWNLVLLGVTLLVSTTGHGWRGQEGAILALVKTEQVE